MDRNCNCGVCCDVTCCCHNMRGCECGLDKIEVSTGDANSAHFCKSFRPKI